MEDWSRYESADLHEHALRLARAEREASADLLACLAEVERQKVYADMAYPNMFEYCVGALCLSEGAAGRRLGAMRTAQRHPVAYSYLRAGELSVSVLCRLEPYVTKENAEVILSRAAGLRRKAFEDLVAELSTSKDRIAREDARVAEASAAPTLPLLQEPTPSDALAEARRVPDRIVATGREKRVRISFEANDGLRGKLERVSCIFAHRVPDGRLEALIELLVDAALERFENIGRLRPRRAASKTRRVPAWIRRIVWSRDEGRCSYRSPGGARCESKRFLQYDHIVPWALGGRSDDASNIRLLCRAHNLRLGRKAFPEATARALERRRGADGGEAGGDTGGRTL